MKINLRIKFIRIIILTLAVVTVYYFAVPNFINNSEIRAAGDLAVNWGVAEGDTIFVITNAVPGDSENRNVTVTNSSPSQRPVGVRGIENSETQNLKSVLEITISTDGTDIYGGTAGVKTLNQFFTDSAGPEGIFLTNLNTGESKNLNFKIMFPQSAGNEFQGANVVFDLIIGISIDLPQNCDQINLLPSPIIGTSKAETLTGTPGNDLIMGLEGADRINGNGGDDCILGGEGADRINGNSGNDAIFGENGADTINGNNGDDFISGQSGGDTLRGENGQDRILGGLDADRIEGGNDNDILEGGEVADTIRGGNGDDTIFGNDGVDTLRGEGGNDNITGGGGVDTANGGPNIDTCDAETKTQCEL